MCIDHVNYEPIDKNYCKWLTNKVSLVNKKRTKILRPNNANKFIPQSQILLPTINSKKKGFIFLAILEVLIGLNSPH